MIRYINRSYFFNSIDLNSYAHMELWTGKERENIT